MVYLYYYYYYITIIILESKKKVEKKRCRPAPIIETLGGAPQSFNNKKYI